VIIIYLLSFDQAGKLGWSLFDTESKKLIDYGIEDFTKVRTPEGRISKIKTRMNELIITTKAEVFAIENIQYQGMLNAYTFLAKLLGVVENNFFEKEMVYIMVKSSEWKSTCGVKGRKREEQKANAQAFVKEKFGIDVEEDAADSICIGFHVITKILK